MSSNVLKFSKSNKHTFGITLSCLSIGRFHTRRRANRLYIRMASGLFVLTEMVLMLLIISNYKLLSQIHKGPSLRIGFPRARLFSALPAQRFFKIVLIINTIIIVIFH